ncbi:farnesyl-diphosphate synthase [Clostridium collagenovorans DSM 3089]|uniref:Farnesyl diphosphate synthase n=1 Tax=Clostridium collagenovorans DSM 3089 TaxID=1121306 RepID=A0A1M5T5L8_9CLOT|nr:farnesyl diphosphate synthase [Clostridium collagenovorans]SHH45653.1 farnesyl-diphosphate synthase [Clostridium collagenovorans DSM 3089]
MNISELKNEVSCWLKEYFDNKGTYEKTIYESMAYSVNVGGKRIRPILMLLTYDLYKENYKDIMPIAGALEMIHTYSLIHDDLPCMDNDDLRRGMPTNHIKFGEAMAVLAGDGLLNEAFKILFKESLNGKQEYIESSYLISKASSVEGMIAGQVVDILNEGKKITEEELFFTHRNKTGELIKVAIVAGAILGEASKEDRAVLEEYGEKLGLAFQIKDDVLDVEGDVKKLGKNTLSDEENNKTTFVTLYGIEKCKDMEQELYYKCMELLKSLQKSTKDLEDLTKFLLEREF